LVAAKWDYGVLIARIGFRFVLRHSRRSRPYPGADQLATNKPRLAAKQNCSAASTETCELWKQLHRPDVLLIQRLS
jgi:hypothetical protein